MVVFEAVPFFVMLALRAGSAMAFARVLSRLLIGRERSAVVAAMAARADFVEVTLGMLSTGMSGEVKGMMNVGFKS